MHSYILSNFSQTKAKGKIIEIGKLNLDSEKIEHHPDIFHVNPEINEKTILQKPSIKIEQVRQIPLKLSQKPIQLNKKILIIWQAETMGIAAANAFLKFLEEPSADTLVFLVVQNYQNLLSTITSRCQIIIGKNKTKDLKTKSDIDLHKLYHAHPAQRMSLIEAQTKNQKEAMFWLETLINITCSKLSGCSTKGLKSMYQLLQNCQIIYNDIKISNVNYKLALDMLAIFWDKPITALDES